MIVTMIAASLAAQMPIADVGYAELVSGRPDAAIVIMEANQNAGDPARLINLGIAHARNGDRQKARALFEQAYLARDWVELETAGGDWVDSRTLARQALAMLETGGFARTGQLARK